MGRLFFMAIFSDIVKPALDSVTNLVSEFHLSPEDKLKFQQASAELVQRTQQSALDYDVKLNDIAGQNIRAEAQSGDKYTERARPTFLYVIIAIFAFNYIFLPIAKIFGSHVDPINMPGELLTFFGVCITGYVVNHSAEKVLSLPGVTELSAFGLKASNKGK